MAIIRTLLLPGLCLALLPCLAGLDPAGARLALDHGVTNLLFVRRYTLTCSHVYTEFIDSRWTPGGNLSVLDLRTGKVRDLVPGFTNGVFGRVDVSFDAERALFGYKRSAREGYRIWEVGLDGTGLRQLTFASPHDAELVKRYGYESNDLHPCYLPDGGIVFTSTRTEYAVLCDSSSRFTAPVLHRMDGDGKNLHSISPNILSEMSPAVLPDGRILYMRWEYNRKGAGAVKCLWTIRPDGTGTSEFYGDNIVDPETMLYGRPIPDSEKVCFLGCSHWGPNNGVGAVFILDTKIDVTLAAAMKRITPDVDAQTHGGYTFRVNGKWVNDSTGKPGPLYKDPYPLAENCILASRKPKGLAWSDPHGYDLILLDGEGRETPLYRDDTFSCWCAYPVRPRAVPPVLTGVVRTDLAKDAAAEWVAMDVYSGLKGVVPGEIKSLRVLDQVPRPWCARIRWNTQTARDAESMAHSALGPWILGLHVVRGEAPVAADGSAHLLVPAGRCLYLQALDAEGRALQTERTVVYSRPGEVRGCVGCHERGAAAAPSGEAAKRPAVKLAPDRGLPSGVCDYERTIQPIWNAHCASCHASKGKAAAKLDLSGERTKLYCRSYESLVHRGPALVGRQGSENGLRNDLPQVPAKSYGAWTSTLAGLVGGFEPSFETFGPAAKGMKTRFEALRKKHPALKLTDAEKRAVYAWLDLSCEYYPSYWGKKNLAHSGEGGFRPAVTLDEAVAPEPPATLRAIYARP